MDHIIYSDGGFITDGVQKTLLDIAQIRTRPLHDSALLQFYLEFCILRISVAGLGIGKYRASVALTGSHDYSFLPFFVRGRLFTDSVPDVDYIRNGA
jgi:hypothetical protein